MHLFLFVALVLAGCADPYEDAKKADTVEAYETFLATNPGGADQLMAETRLETLLVEKATESKLVADYDKVLTRFPRTKKLEEVQKGRAAAAYAVAEADGSVEAWKKFMDEDPFADSALKKRATTMIDVAKYTPTIAFGDVAVAEVNLANDPAGPKDGWGFTADVTNNGAEALEYANVELQFLGADGKKLGKSPSYPIAAPTGPGGMPIEEALIKPLAPAEKRTWTYTTGEVPEGWAEGKKVKLVLIGARPAPPADPAAPK